jgi:hypothetical protein
VAEPRQVGSIEGALHGSTLERSSRPFDSSAWNNLHTL